MRRSARKESGEWYARKRENRSEEEENALLMRLRRCRGRGRSYLRVIIDERASERVRALSLLVQCDPPPIQAILTRRGQEEREEAKLSEASLISAKAVGSLPWPSLSISSPSSAPCVPPNQDASPCHPPTESVHPAKPSPAPNSSTYRRSKAEEVSRAALINPLEGRDKGGGRVGRGGDVLTNVSETGCTTRGCFRLSRSRRREGRTVSASRRHCEEWDRKRIS